MSQVCSRCQHTNPDHAVFCYFDGAGLAGHTNLGPMHVGSRPFPHPFTFPDGQSAANFNQLAIRCQQNWDIAKNLLQEGWISQFLGSMGRLDLAKATDEFKTTYDADHALDMLLQKLPADSVDPPKLQAEPLVVNLGAIRAGEQRSFDLTIRNQGMRLLHGAVVSTSAWLVVGDGAHPGQKIFQTPDETKVVVKILGDQLRAGLGPWEGNLVIDSNGGTLQAVIRLDMPVIAFPHGVLQGAKTPREIAARAKKHIKEAALLFENGAVEKWYKDNGWIYPVQGPAGTGIGAVQQFYEALGLVKAPQVTISDSAIHWAAKPGEKISHPFVVRTNENRPVFATAASDQPWLKIGKPQSNGNYVLLPMDVHSVPANPGEVLQAKVRVRANGNQQFVVPVSLKVGQTYGSPPPRQHTTATKRTTNVGIKTASPRLEEQAVAAIPLGPPITRTSSAPVPKRKANQSFFPEFTWESSRQLYWCGILGGWSAFLGWLFAELLMGRAVGDSLLLAILMVVIVGMFIGGGLSIVSEMANRHWREQVQRIGPGLIGGLLGGLVGGLLGNFIYYLLGPNVFILGFFARVIGWMALGVSIGAAEGIYERSWRKTRNGMIGGALGGFLGGVLFNPISYIVGSPLSGRAMAFVLLGMFIGVFVGLVRFLLKEAWLTVVDGFRPGRELILEQDVTTMGTSEKASLIFIAFGAKGVEPVHLRVRRFPNGRYVVEDNASRSGTFVNGARVQGATPLQDGDEIQFGVNKVKFRETYRQASPTKPVAGSIPVAELVR